jgi:SDR family mycofactocin-dependent oxidoreductase
MTRVALVTGAARGIGAATVARLSADAWSVVAVDRASDDPRLRYPMGTAAELDAVVHAAHDAIAFRADASDLDAMAEAVQVAEQRFGGLDAVIAVAGVIAGGVPQWDLPPEQEQAVMDVNLGGVLVASRVGIPALLRRPAPRQGRFIAIASAASVRGLPMLAAYCAAKAGVLGLVRGLAADLRGTGITVNAVSPGSTATRILDESARLYALESAEAFSTQQPLERLLSPEEIASAIAWLAGPEASGITGAAVPVDGGLAI